MTETALKFNIQFKFFIILISTMVFISSTIVFFFVTWTRNELYKEAGKRGEIEAKSLAYDAKYGVITEDSVILDHLIAGRMAKPDITCIFITKDDGTILTKGIREECVFCNDINDKSLLLANSPSFPSLNPPYSSLDRGDKGGMGGFSDETKPKVHLGKAVYRSGIMSKNGQKIYMFTAPILTERVEIPEKEKLIENILFFTDEPTKYSPIIRGTVNLGMSLANIDKMVQNTLAVSVLIIFLVIAVSLAISSRFIRIITEPIKKVAEVARQISRGDLTKTVEVCSSDEVGIMAENFNRMTTTLRKTISELLDLKDDLERKVYERTKKLKYAVNVQTNLLKEVENANKELQSFAYVVSHDLKAPLRAINSLATWILDDYGDKFDEDGKEQMRLLIGRVKRMHNLIDGILKYSRTGQAKEQIVKIDINVLTREIIDILHPPEHIEIKIKDELPIIFYGKIHIEQLLQNLLSNAIKFIDKPKGEIIISCVDVNDYWKFSVSDNGPGIDEKHFENIFKIFQTLSPRDRFESTGIGLTVSKKIVEMYGGKIELKSRIGQGSAFCFTIPKKIEVAKLKVFGNGAENKES